MKCIFCGLQDIYSLEAGELCPENYDPQGDKQDVHLWEGTPSRPYVVVETNEMDSTFSCSAEVDALVVNYADADNDWSYAADLYAQTYQSKAIPEIHLTRIRHNLNIAWAHKPLKVNHAN